MFSITLIEILMDKIPDADTRQAIYTALLEQCDYTDIDNIEDVMDIDAAFDAIAEDYIDSLDDDDEDDDYFEEDEDYEDDE